MMIQESAVQFQKRDGTPEEKMQRIRRDNTIKEERRIERGRKAPEKSEKAVKQPPSKKSDK